MLWRSRLKGFRNAGWCLREGRGAILYRVIREAYLISDDFWERSERMEWVISPPGDTYTCPFVLAGSLAQTRRLAVNFREVKRTNNKALHNTWPCSQFISHDPYTPYIQLNLLSWLKFLTVPLPVTKRESFPVTLCKQPKSVIQVEISTLRPWLLELAMGTQDEKDAETAGFATGHAYTVKKLQGNWAVIWVLEWWVFKVLLLM